MGSAWFPFIAMGRHGFDPHSSALQADAFTRLAYSPKKITACIDLQTVEYCLYYAVYPGCLPDMRVCRLFIYVNSRYDPGMLRVITSFSSQAETNGVQSPSCFLVFIWSAVNKCFIVPRVYALPFQKNIPVLKTHVAFQDRHFP